MPIHTPDRRYIVVRERLWRASNPELPERVRAALTRELMSARRAVRAARQARDETTELQARRRIHQAKVALGERGPVWWEDGAPDLNRRMIENTSYRDWWQDTTTIQATIAELLAARGPGKTICPSEVARSMRTTGWRALMPAIREVARELIRDRKVEVLQKGETLPADAEWRGPIRIRTARDTSGSGS